MAITSVRQNQNWCATLRILAGMNSLLLNWRVHRICVSSCMKKVRIVLSFEPNSHRRYVTAYIFMAEFSYPCVSCILPESFLEVCCCSELEAKLVSFSSCVMYNIQTTVKPNSSFMKEL
jgi:hypothetical protein